MRKIKKITSIFLAALLATSVTAVSLGSVSAIVDENGCYVPGDNVKATNRYYFAMPNSWLNDYTDTAGVYWWTGTDANGAIDGSGGTVTWPGYKVQRGGNKYDTCEVYYVDCPTDVSYIIWNNHIDGGTDSTAAVFSAAKQANDANTEFYSEFDSELYSPEWFKEMEESYNGDKSALGEYADNFFYDEEYGLGFSFGFNNMIYVIDSSKTTENFIGRIVSVGDWYFCYGNGEYGIYPTREEAVAKGALNNLYEWKDVTSTPDVSVPTNPVPTNPIVPTPTVPVYPDDDEGTISFDVKKSGWDLNTNKKFYCHIWKYDGSSTSSGADWPQWQTKQELCALDTDTGIATFDLAKTGHNFDVSDGAVYCVIFSSNTGRQTYNTIMSGACIGDTMYCTDVQIENPEDSEKKCSEAVWENNPDCGPEKKITSTGNVVGSAYPEGETDATLLANYLLQYYDDPAKIALTQNLLNTLNVSPYDVMDVVYERAYDESQIDTIYDILLNGSDSNESYYNGFFYYKNNDRTAVITGCDGDEEELVIPRTIQGYKVKSIDYFAFEDCTALKSVTISNGITDIYDYAFVNCNNLKSVTIPSSVTYIGLYALGFRESEYTDDYIKIDGFTIKGVKGSVAEEYANEFGFDFVAVEEDIFGDVDGNGVLSVADATLIQKCTADLIEFTDSQIKAADVNGDGTVNVLDATAVQKMLVGRAG